MAFADGGHGYTVGRDFVCPGQSLLPRTEKIESIEKASHGLKTMNELCDLFATMSSDDSNQEWYPVWQTIQTNPEPRIVLLRYKQVVQWLYGDLSFLGPIVTKNKTQDTTEYTVLEDR